MEMCYDGALVMPGSYAVMSEEEMTYVEGGEEVKVQKAFLNKSVCKKTALKYTKKTGMSQMRIAKEIYAHAYMFYLSPAAIAGTYAVIAVGCGTANLLLPCLYYIRNHSNPINLGGDSSFRVSVYNAIWNYF